METGKPTHEKSSKTDDQFPKDILGQFFRSMNILHKAIKIQYQSGSIRADDLMQSLIVARKETAKTSNNV